VGENVYGYSMAKADLSKFASGEACGGERKAWKRGDAYADQHFFGQEDKPGTVA